MLFMEFGCLQRETGEGEYVCLETFMVVVQRAGAGSKPSIFRVVSKSDSIHGTATTATEPLS